MSELFLPLLDKSRCLSWTVDAAPCQAACPLAVDVEAYVTAVASQKFSAALEIIREKCPLPAVCGRVCHHPCEAECKRGRLDEPVAIRALKRFAADQAGKQKPSSPSPAVRPQRIAVVGSGPAGLTAAHDLAGLGYRATVFESRSLAGGMLACIPAFDLPQEVIQRDIDAIRALGVEIRTGTPIGDNPPLRDLFSRGFQAVLVATGAQESARLAVPGADLAGVMYALPFLKEAKEGLARRLDGRVLVIGGGNAAMDAARTAVRLGAAEVHLAARRKVLPAFPWMVRAAEAEGIGIHTSLAPQALLGDARGRVSGVEFKKVGSSTRNAHGRVALQFEEGPGSQVMLPADWVIIAIGQKAHTVAGEAWGLETTPSGTIKVDALTWATAVPGVFAAGDAVFFPGTVVEAMAAGRKAAAAIDRFLKGEGEETPASISEVVTGKDILPEGLPPRRRVATPVLPPEEAAGNFGETELGFTPQQAVEEAARCLRCKTCNLCLEETRCVAFSPVDHQGKRSPLVKGDLCGGCGRCARSCPYGNIFLSEI